MKTQCFCLTLAFTFFSSTLSARHQPTFNLLFPFVVLGGLLNRDPPIRPEGLLLKQDPYSFTHWTISDNGLISPKGELLQCYNKKLFLSGLWDELSPGQCQPEHTTVIVMPLSGSVSANRFQVGNQCFVLRLPSSGTEEREKLVKLLMSEGRNGTAYWEILARQLGLSNLQIKNLKKEKKKPAESLLLHVEDRYPHAAATILYGHFIAINSKLSDLLMEPVQPETEEQAESSSGGESACDLGTENQSEAESEPAPDKEKQLLLAFPFYGSLDYDVIVTFIKMFPAPGQNWQALASLAGLSGQEIEYFKNEGTVKQAINTILERIVQNNPDQKDAFSFFLTILRGVGNLGAAARVSRWAKSDSSDNSRSKED